MEILNNYLVPVIIVICLAVGYILKHWVEDVDNKIIPTVCACLGVALAVIMNLDAITVEVVAGGLVSGLASTGLHQLFKQWIDNGSE